MRKIFLLFALLLSSFFVFSQNIPDTLGSVIQTYSISKYKVDELLYSTWTDTPWYNGTGEVLIYKDFIELKDFTDTIYRDVYLIFWRNRNKGYLIQLKTFAVVDFKFYKIDEYKALELTDGKHKVNIIFYVLDFI